MYAKYLKRIFDFILSFITLIILSPFLFVLIIVGAIMMKGNPFFIQKRPGLNEKIFKLIKFRTMSEAKDKNGKLLPDSERLNGYGRFLRLTSLDELPEFVNILKGDLSIVGPRPLLIEYLPWYTEKERHRHDVRPGLTGLAQVSGRNSLKWNERFEKDLQYVDDITFVKDMRILFLTVKKVLLRSDVSDDTSVSEGNFAELRRQGKV